ncbi:DNA cytosine methyltransferase [Bradyrhizobium sp. HKCCYLS1011]|uniref:DNA cytosine methyltransferase n=1 Tax=Bradyrhizobium sp. HKCCYLS1011 TaxID=3420733 RepID=UPI003EB9A95D
MVPDRHWSIAPFISVNNLVFCSRVSSYVVLFNESERKENGVARSLNVTALFAGIGGLELGLHRAGHQTTLFCESDTEAAAVLAARFKRIKIMPDVRDVRGLLKAISPRSNLLTAGFPCTDLSQAGRTQGFEGEQSVLVRETLELLRRRPFDHVLLENVPNWRTLHKGRYLEEVVSKLEQLGYCWAFRTIDARAFGIPQRRRRVFLYATLVGDPREVLFQGNESELEHKRPITESAHGFYWTEGTRGLGWGEDCIPTFKGGSAVSIPSPPAILLPDGRIVTPDIRDAERFQGFDPGWTDVTDLRGQQNVLPFRHRRRWSQVGNAVNVEVSTWIGQQLRRPQAATPVSERMLTPGEAWPEAAWGFGGRRWAADIGAWPVARRAEPLADFLQFSSPLLSERATAGFLKRITASRLRFVPGFKEAVEAHLDVVSAIGNSGPLPGRRSIADIRQVAVGAE